MLNGYKPEIELGQLLAIIHQPTQIMKIAVVDSEWVKYGESPIDYLTFDAFNGEFGYGGSETERLLKYYAKVPVWNLVCVIDPVFESKTKGCQVVSTLKAHCHWKDVKEAYLKEQSDIKRTKRHEYYLKRKKRERRSSGQ